MSRYQYVLVSPSDMDGAEYAGIVIPKRIRDYGVGAGTTFVLPGLGIVTWDQVHWVAYDRSGESVGFFPTRQAAADALV